MYVLHKLAHINITLIEEHYLKYCKILNIAIVIARRVSKCLASEGVSKYYTIK